MNNEMKGTFADPNNIFCRTCAFRDKTEIELNGKIIPVGITKGNCQIFVYPNNKPSDVLFQNAPCEFFESEE